jgi:hypothetical protein
MRRNNNIYKDKIIAMWHENYTSGQIAKELGISRGAVMGVVHREKNKSIIKIRRVPKVKLTPRIQVERPKKKPFTLPNYTRPNMRKHVKNPLQGEFDLYVPPPPKSLFDLGPYDCRWIHDNGGYCGDRVKPNKSWCCKHYDIVYIKGSNLTKVAA